MSLLKFLEGEIEVEALEDPLCRLLSEWEIWEGDKVVVLEELIFLFESYEASGIYLHYNVGYKNYHPEFLHKRIIKLPNEV